MSSSLVQSVERRTVNPYVAGSSPAGGAKFSFGVFLFISFYKNLFKNEAPYPPYGAYFLSKSFPPLTYPDLSVKYLANNHFHFMICHF